MPNQTITLDWYARNHYGTRHEYIADGVLRADCELLTHLKTTTATNRAGLARIIERVTYQPIEWREVPAPREAAS